MKSILVCFITFLAVNVVSGQVNCEDILLNAKAAILDENLEQALSDLQDLEVCDYENKLVKERQALQKKIFQLIGEQKNAAEESARIAELGKMKALRDAKSAKLTARAIDTEQNGDKTLALHLANEACQIAGESSLLAHKTRHDILSNPKNNFVNCIFEGHALGVTAVAFSPDGKTVLTGSLDNTVKLWDLNGRLLQTLYGHSTKVTNITYSPDGEILLTGGLHQTKLWNLNGDLLHTMNDIDAYFSPDGKRIICLGIGDFPYIFVKNFNGYVHQEFFSKFVYEVSIVNSPNGEFLISYSDSPNGGGAILLSSDGKIVCDIGNEELIYNSVFSPDGNNILITGSETTRLLDLKGNLIKKFPSRYSMGIFSPSGKSILAAYGNEVSLLNLSGEVIQSFIGHNQRVEAIAFSPDEKFILSGSSDGTAKLWELSNKNDIHCSFSTVNAVAFSPDGKSLLIGGQADNDFNCIPDIAYLWDLQGNLLNNKLSEKERLATTVTFSPDGKIILIGGYEKNKEYDGSVSLWDSSGKLLNAIQPALGGLESVDFSPDGKKILIGTLGGGVEWDFIQNKIKTFLVGDKVFMVKYLKRGKKVLTFSERGLEIWDLNFTNSSQVNSPFWLQDFHPENNILLTAGKNGVSIWDLKGNLLNTFYQKEVEFATFSPDGEKILAISLDKIIFIWDLGGSLIKKFSNLGDLKQIKISSTGDYFVGILKSETVVLFDFNGNPKQVFHGESQINCWEFSPDGKTILIGSEDDFSVLWNLQGEIIQIFGGHKGGINTVSFSPDGKTLLTGSSDRTAKLWDLNGKLLHTLVGHQASINTVSFSPDAKTLLTGSDDRTAKLWDLNGKLLHTLVGHQASINTVSFSPDAKTLLTGSDDRTAKLWDLNGKLLHTFAGHTAPINAVSFSPDGKTLLTGSNDLKIWNLNGQIEKTFNSGSTGILKAFFSQNGKVVYAILDKGTYNEDLVVEGWVISQEINNHSAWTCDHLDVEEFSPSYDRVIGKGNPFRLYPNSFELLGNGGIASLTIKQKINNDLITEEYCINSDDPIELLGCAKYFFQKDVSKGGQRNSSPIDFYPSYYVNYKKENLQTSLLLAERADSLGPGTEAFVFASDIRYILNQLEGED